MPLSRAPTKRIGRKRKTLGWNLLALATLTVAAWVCSGWLQVFVLETTRLNAPELSAAQIARPYPYCVEGRSQTVTLPRLSVENGAIRLSLVWVERGDQSDVTIETRHRSWYWHRQDFNLGGSSAFEWKQTTWAPTLGVERLDVTLPAWLPSVVLSLIGGCLLWSGEFARQRIQNNGCRTCGYNLTGVTQIARCPECGASTDTTTRERKELAVASLP